MLRYVNIRVLKYKIQFDKNFFNLSILTFRLKVFGKVREILKYEIFVFQSWDLGLELWIVEI